MVKTEYLRNEKLTEIGIFIPRMNKLVGEIDDLIRQD